MREEAKNTKKLDNKGFSLIELIIVIAIMAILIGIVGTQVVPYIEKSKQAKDQQILSGYLTNATTAFASNADTLDDSKSFGFVIGSTPSSFTLGDDPGDKVKDEFYELAGLAKTTPAGGGTASVNLTAITDKMSSKAGKAIKGVMIQRDSNGKVTVTANVTDTKYQNVFTPLSST